MIISAEDISLFEETQWRELGQCLIEAQTLSGVQISNLGFYFVAREFEDRLRSAAKGQYKYGAALPLEELIDLIRSTNSPKFELIEKIPEFMPLASSLNYIPFAGGDLIRRWCDVVLGDEASSHLPESAFGVIVNVAMVDSTYEELRKFNVFNTPAKLARGFSALSNQKPRKTLSPWNGSRLQGGLLLSVMTTTQKRTGSPINFRNSKKISDVGIYANPRREQLT